MADDPTPIRKTSWTRKIAAKPEALAFYKALEEAHRVNAFEDCHILHGPKGPNKNPTIWDPAKNYARKASLVIAHFLQIDLPGRQQCSTPGCINPTHFGPVNIHTDFSPDFPSERLFPIDLEKMRLISSVKEMPVANRPEAFISTPPIQDWIEMIEYLRDKRGILQGMTYQEYRNMIPVEDIGDEYLPTVFEQMPMGWKKEML